MSKPQVMVQKIEAKNLAFFTSKYESVRVSSVLEEEINSHIQAIENNVRAQLDITKEQQDCLNYLYSVKSKVVGCKVHARKR